MVDGVCSLNASALFKFSTANFRRPLGGEQAVVDLSLTLRRPAGITSGRSALFLKCRHAQAGHG